MSDPRFFTENEIEALNGIAVANEALEKMRGSNVPPDYLFYNLARLRKLHERRAFMCEVQKMVVRGLTEKPRGLPTASKHPSKGGAA